MIRALEPSRAPWLMCQKGDIDFRGTLKEAPALLTAEGIGPANIGAAGCDLIPLQRHAAYWVEFGRTHPVCHYHSSRLKPVLRPDRGLRLFLSLRLQCASLCQRHLDVNLGRHAESLLTQRAVHRHWCPRDVLLSAWKSALWVGCLCGNLTTQLALGLHRQCRRMICAHQPTGKPAPFLRSGQAGTGAAGVLRRAGARFQPQPPRSFSMRFL